jgi:iron complex outermembrane receptor protein
MRPSDLLRGASACALMIPLCSAPAAAQEALPTIDVAGSGPPSGAKPSLSGSPADKETGYRRTTSFGATKTDTPLLNTPVAVQIVPREVIVDKQVLDTQEAVKNVSGVQAQPGTYYDQYLIRGFTSGYGATWRNGLKMEGMIGGAEVAFTDRVEIVKGPGSVLYGRIEPGGFVNVVTKRPQEEFKAELTQQVGNWGLARTAVDITGAVDAEKTVLYRLMGVYDRSDSFTDFDHRDNGAAALYLSFRPTQDFEFNVQFEHYEKKQTTPDGSGTVPVIITPGAVTYPINLPRHFSVGDPALWGAFPLTVHRTHYAFDWTYQIDENWKVRNRFLYVDEQQNQTALTNWAGWDGANITRGFVHNPLSRSNLSTNLDLAGELWTGPIRHKTLVGLDWFKYQDDWVGDYGFTLPTAPLNIYAPVYGNLTPILHYLAGSARANVLWRTRRQDFGVYAQDQISLFDDRLQILLGGRWDKAVQRVASVYGADGEDCFPGCTGYPLNTYSDRPKLSPRAAALIKVTDDISVFGSYVRSFGANNGASASGQIFPPEQAYQWEAGAKSVWFDGDLTASVALFDLTKTNIVKADPLNPGLTVPVGVVNSRGVEVDVAGRVTENLSLIGSYTFDVAKIVDDNGNGFVGHRFNSVAPHVGNIWAKWDTAPGRPEGWEFGFGAYASDERWGADDNTWKMPAYVKFDMMIAWRTLIDDHKVTFRFNVKNLSDTKYFERSDAWMFAYYGAPRTFVGSVNFQF